MIKQVVAVAVVLTFPLNTVAEDLLEVYESARQYDPQMQAATAAYEAVKEAVPQARAALLPGVSVDARISRVKEKTGEQAASIFGQRDSNQDYKSTSYSIQATQPLFRYGDWVGLRQAHASVRRGFALYTAQEQDLILRTATAYIGVQAAKDALNFAQAEKAAIGRQLDLVKARRRGGLATLTDEQEARARFSRVVSDVIGAEFLLDDAYEGLTEIVKERMTELSSLRTDFQVVGPEPENVEFWLTKAAENNLSIIAARESVELAMEEISRRKAGAYPELDLIVRHGNVDSDQGLASLSGGVNDVDTTEVALQLNLVLYAGGAIRSQSRQAVAQHNQALSERDQVLRRVSRETRAAYQAIVQAISRIGALRDSVAAQQSVLQGKSKGLASGVNTLFEVLDAESDLYSTKRDLANAGYDYLLNTLRLKQQVGSLAESDLNSINSLAE